MACNTTYDPLSSSCDEEEHVDINIKQSKKKKYTSIVRYEPSLHSSTPLAKTKVTAFKHSPGISFNLSRRSTDENEISDTSLAERIVMEDEDQPSSSSTRITTSKSGNIARNDTPNVNATKDSLEKENEVEPSNKDIMDAMKKLLKQNKEMKQRLEEVENLNKKKGKKERVAVPLEVKHHVRFGYEQACKNCRQYGEWKVDIGLNAFSDENKATTNYVKNFVVGLHPDLENKDLVINSAIKTHFESKRTMKRKKLKDPSSGKKQAKLQRKVNKMNRRKHGLDLLDDSRISKENKVKWKKAMVREMMSSEDEKNEDGRVCFEVKPLQFTTKKFNKLKRLCDNAYMDSCSQQSRDQFKKREIGSPSKRKPPTSLPFGYDIFIKQQ